MSNKELIEYLNTFPEDAHISLILANPRERKLYDVVNTFGVIDVSSPMFCIEIGAVHDMDADMLAVCEADEEETQQLAGQMNITDYSEVLP